MSVLFCSICYFLCYLFQIIFLILEQKQKIVATLYLKGLASITFVVLGAISYCYASNYAFISFVLVGLIFDALADVVFNLRFAFPKIHNQSFFGGTLLFFIGHIFYLIALVPQVHFWWIYLIIGVGFSVLVQIFFAFNLKNLSKMHLAYGIIYLATVSSMAALAIGYLVTSPRTSGPILFAIGAVFFLISDIMLIYNTFRNKKIYPVRVISFVTYYTGQLLIATSLFLL